MDWWPPGLSEASTRVVGSQLTGPPVQGPQGGYRDVVASPRDCLCLCEQRCCHHPSRGPEAPRCQVCPGVSERQGSCGAWQEAGGGQAGSEGL